MKKANLNENNFEVEHVAKVLVQNGYVERQVLISNVVTGKARVL